VNRPAYEDKVGAARCVPIYSSATLRSQLGEVLDFTTGAAAILAQAPVDFRRPR
jgi:hypothetical protein